MLYILLILAVLYACGNTIWLLPVALTGLALLVRYLYVARDPLWTAPKDTHYSYERQDIPLRKRRK